MPTPRLIAALAALMLCTAAAAPPGQTIKWDAKQDGDPKTYAAGELKLTFTASHPTNSDDIRAPVLTVVSPRFGRAVLPGQAGFANPAAEAAVVTLDPKADGPAVILTSYSGGAHCCTEVTILDPVGGVWRRVDGGDWNSGGPKLPPKDLDGDGVPDFLLSDDQFLYAFACYACGSAPPKIVDVMGGVWTDVSTAPRFARVFREDAARVKAGCGENGGQNGLCAVYVADEARLGRFGQAWRYMLAHYSKTDDWGLPTGCRVPRSPDHGCPAGQEIKFKTYPEALKAFLLEAGYVTQGEAAAVG